MISGQRACEGSSDTRSFRKDHSGFMKSLDIRSPPLDLLNMGRSVARVAAGCKSLMVNAIYASPKRRRLGCAAFMAAAIASIWLVLVIAS